MTQKAPDLRRRELAHIHIAKQQLALDDDTYRAMLWAVAQVRSAADLDWRGRKLVLDHLKAKGFRIRSRARPQPAQGKAALIAKIRALLINADPPRPDAYADGMARRMFGVARFDWCTPDQLRKIAAALAIDARRRNSPSPRGGGARGEGA